MRDPLIPDPPNKSIGGGRPWRIALEDLIPRIQKARAEGTSLKTIASELGYSYGRLRVIASRFKISNKKEVDADNSFLLKNSGTPRPEET